MSKPAHLLLNLLLAICLVCQGVAFAGGLSCAHSGASATAAVTVEPPADPHAHHHAAGAQMSAETSADAPSPPGFCDCGCDCANACMASCAVAAVAGSTGLLPWAVPAPLRMTITAVVDSRPLSVLLRPPISV